MSQTTTDRPTSERRPRSTRYPRIDRAAWTCANCHRTTQPPRKRCAECGTSRY